MLVEDHALVRAAVRQAIAAPDVVFVAEAGSAEEALAVVAEARPDVLLVDIDLPGMSGVAMVRELAPRFPTTRIVMLTVSFSDQHLVDAMRYGAAGYLTKDISPDGLLRAIRSAHAGELVVPRRMAAGLVRRLVDGHHPRTVGEGTDGDLTGRETTVLRLLADGLTDREIADTLTISPRTVETHVSHVLHKLGVRNRAEAARRFRGWEG
jgi:two-component system nitrate/nitrite response regulator NarL